MRTVEELEAIFETPVLGVIPEDPEVMIRPVIPTDSAWSAAVARLRMRLRHLDDSHRLETLVVTSAAPGDGKTTVAYNLAVAATRDGTSTLLIEADLRRPELASRLGLEADPGLSSVLVRGCGFEESIRSMALRVDRDGRLGGVLDILPAGSVTPPSPAELLDSRAFDAVLAKARDAYELVILDTPAIDAVPDAIPVMARADGAIVVSDLRRGRRDAFHRLRRTLAELRAPVLGVVANRSRRRPTEPYGQSPARAQSPGIKLSRNGRTPELGVGARTGPAEEGWE